MVRAASLINSVLRELGPSQGPTAAVAQRSLATTAGRRDQDPRDSQTFTLSDGRKLGFAEYGEATGKPVFFFHGLPSARIEVESFSEPAAKLGVRLISPDRPGIGISSPQPNRRLTDWPSDVQQLAQNLGLGTYSVLGGSGGGPYALACARFLPKTSLKSVGVLAGAAPWEAGRAGVNWSSRSLAFLTAYFPSAMRFLAERWLATPLQTHSEEELKARLDKFLATLSEEELAEIERVPEGKDDVIRVAKESFRQGVDGYMQECSILTRPWGFKLEEIDSPRVLFWYAQKDRNTTLAMGKWMAERVPGAVLREYSGENHYNVGQHFEENLRELIQDQ